MKKTLAFVYLTFILNFNVSSQFSYINPVRLSEQSSISLLTIDRADEELFQAFGHIAVFIYDPVNQIDRVYGYGAFDFNTDNFYWKFIRGELPYQISVTDIRTTMLEYGPQYENRSINQQLLTLSTAQKQKVFDILEENYLPQNRTYQYKFFQDNCSTRIRDVFKKAMGDSLKITTTGIEQGESFRYWMNKNLPNTPWARFGMNLAIGHPSDVPNKNEETLYIPDNMRIAFDHATNGGLALVKNNVKLYESFKPETKKNTSFTPIIVFILLFVLGLVLSYFQFSKNSQSTLFDSVLLFSSGILGLLIVFLWFFTSHGVTMYNWNLLWAWPSNIVVAFMIKNRNKAVLNYLKVYQAFLLLAIGIGLVFGFFKSEIYPWAILPFLALLIIRISLFKINNNPKNLELK